MDSINPFLLINRNEGPQGIGIFSLSTNETVAGPNFPDDFLYLYSDGAWGLAGKYDVGEEFGQDERCTVILASLEEARGKVIYVYGIDDNGEWVIPQRVRTGFFRGNPSTDDYQICLLEKSDNIVDYCILWISHTIQNPLGDGDVVNEDNPVVFNQNGGDILWTRHLIGIEEHFDDASSLLFWENSIYWISGTGLVHGINLNTLAHTRYMLHPDIEFHDDMQGLGPCAYLSIDRDHHRVLYIFTSPDQTWICELFNLGNDGLIFPIPHDERIEGNALFVNRGQSALLKEVEDLSMHLEDKILQGPLPNDCQMYNIETNQWQVIKICAHPVCEGLWFFSDVENLGQEHIHYDYVANFLEHGGGAAPPAVVAAEGQKEEEEDVPVVIDNVSTVLTRTAVAVQVNGAQKFSQYHGGTNFGRSASPFMTTSYYDMAPLDEYGLVWQPTWAHLKGLHAAVKQSAQPLLYGTYSTLSLGNLTEAHVFQTGSNCVAFLVNTNLRGKVDIQFRNNKFELPARSVIILSQCNKIIFNTPEVTAPSYTRSSRVLQSLNGASKWSWTSERIPDLTGAKFANKLLDQLSTTKDAADYLWYITRYNSTSAGGNQVLHVELDAHVIHAFVNNMLVGSAHGNDQNPSATLDAKFVPNKGENTISLLSVMVGSPDGGAHLERKYTGLRTVKIQGTGRNSNPIDLSNQAWGYQVGVYGEENKFYSPEGSTKANWMGILLQNSRNQPLRWYKTTFDMPAGSGPFALNLTSMGKGEAWVNGENIGRYP